MRTGIWILAGIGLAGIGLLAWMSGSLVSSVAGVEEARGLQEGFLASSGGVAVPGTLRVARTLGAGGAGEFRWLVTADLLPGLDPEGAAARTWRERVNARCLFTRIRGKPPAGVILRLRREGGADLRFEVDGSGRPVRGAAPVPAAPAPPPPPSPAPSPPPAPPEPPR